METAEGWSGVSDDRAHCARSRASKRYTEKFSRGDRSGQSFSWYSAIGEVVEIEKGTRRVSPPLVLFKYVSRVRPRPFPPLSLADIPIQCTGRHPGARCFHLFKPAHACCTLNFSFDRIRVSPTKVPYFTFVPCCFWDGGGLQDRCIFRGTELHLRIPGRDVRNCSYRIVHVLFHGHAWTFWGFLGTRGFQM